MSEQTRARPILMSPPMVRAILNGSKTQTRRIMKPQPVPENMGFPDVYVLKQFRGLLSNLERSPYGAKGERLWVREGYSFRVLGGGYVYRADEEAEHDPCVWKNAMFMPRVASRITLEVCSVRVERLQEISEADALAEGITWPDRDGKPFRPPIDTTGVSSLRIAADQYRELWEKIHGPGSWDLNPWVWVIEFKRL